VQVNTGTGCHLDAAMVARAVDALAPAEGSLVLVENVGNLVCPALFDLGETVRVVSWSVTEGLDKPRKYPDMFGSADLVLVTKSDLAPLVGFDARAARAAVPEQVPLLHVSAHTGAGLPAWQAWLSRAGAP
jgi:hydrogenase nickel incorporation protein HypB